MALFTRGTAVALFTLSCKFSVPHPHPGFVGIFTDLDVPYRTDIEQEVNGVYSFDRKAKIDPTKMKAIFDRAAKTYLDGVQDDKKWEVSGSGAGLPISS